jgi:hypothetical protein
MLEFTSLLPAGYRFEGNIGITGSVLAALTLQAGGNSCLDSTRPQKFSGRVIYYGATGINVRASTDRFNRQNTSNETYGEFP